MEKESLLPKASASSIFYTLASLTLVVLCLIYFEALLKPIVIAILIWFIINQLKHSMGKIKIKGKVLPHFIANLLAFLVIFIVLYLVVELLILNIEGIAASMPEYLSNFHESFDKASAFINNPNYAEYIQKGISKLDLPGMAATMLGSLSGTVSTSAVVLVYVIFFLMEDTARKIKLERLFPVKGRQYKKFTQNLQSISASVRYYIWSMTAISLATGAISYLVLLIFHVEYAFLWSFLVFILNFVPYIGPLISSTLPAVFAVVTSGQLMQFVYVFAAMEGIQIIMGSFIQPIVQGKGSNIGPVPVIVSLAFWGMLWGIVGMILAVPVTSVVVIICSQIPSTRYLAVMLSEKGEIPDIETDDA